MVDFRADARRESMMGYWKERQIQEGEQGWRFIDDRSVCAECLTDSALQNIVRANLAAETCSYCGRSESRPIAAELNEILAVMGRGLFSEWSLAERELFRDDGEYVGSTWDTSELFDTIGWPTDNEKLQDDIALAFAENLWCERDPFHFRPEEALAAGWSEFKEMVTTKSRYLFLIAPDSRDVRGYEEIAPADMLGALGRALETAELGCILPAGTSLWRARVHTVGERPASADSLGSPPVARYSNRMSPAGISMFYGALERDTAISEVADRLGPETPVGTVARFTPSGNLHLLDLAELPDVPSLYDDDLRRRRAALLFLRGFAEDIAEPVRPEAIEHVEYVPAQIVAEFIRLHHSAPGGPYHGIIYRSTRMRGGRNVVLFFDHASCYDELPTDGSLGLVLDPTSVQVFD